MAPRKALTPRKPRGEASMSGVQPTNPQTPSESDQDHESGMAFSPPGARTVVRAGRSLKRFDNDASQLVHRHQKTKYSYRLGIRLPTEELRRFPRYTGKVKDFSQQWSGGFVTLKVAPLKLRSILLKKRNLPGSIIVPPLPSSLPSIFGVSAPSIPSLSSTSKSSFSAGPIGPNTPVTTHSFLGTGRTNAQTRLAAKELFAVTTGSLGPHDQTVSSTYGHLLNTSASLDKPFPLSSQPDSAYEDLPVAERLIRDSTMGPVKDTTNVHNTIKDVIQTLTDIQLETHGYIPGTQDHLVDRLTDLTQSLASLKHLTSTQDSPNSYIHQVAIAPEIVDYVDDGRNPDIFTRDFVENVQRGNAVINGKQEAFKDFTQVFAQKLKEGIPGVSGQVDRVLKSAGFDEHERSKMNGADVNGGTTPGMETRL